MTDLQEKLISLPIVAPQKLKGKYSNTDACRRQVVCVILQDQSESVPRPIGSWSRSVTSAEKSYDTTPREFQDVIWAVLMLVP